MKAVDSPNPCLRADRAQMHQGKNGTRRFQRKSAKKLLLIASAFAALMTTAAAGAQTKLVVAAESDSLIWNAVVVDQGRVFVAGPRWTGAKGPAVARIDRNGHAQPYPDSPWNGWQPGHDPAHAFVDVNAIHVDGRGGLWVVDTGGPKFGGDPLPGAAKLVRIDLVSNKVSRIYPLGPKIALPGSYVDDVRFNGSHAYLTDAGKPGLIVLDIETGAARRVLDRHPSVTAPADRSIVLDGKVLMAQNGKPLHVNSDPEELSPNDKWLYYGPLEGPWSRIETRWLDDPSLTTAELASHVETWADLPPTGGTAIDPDGNLYFSDLANDSVKKRAPDGTIRTIIRDARLHWVDALFLDSRGVLWLPVPQLDRLPLFHSGVSHIERPIRLYRIDPRATN